MTKAINILKMVLALSVAIAIAGCEGGLPAQRGSAAALPSPAAAATQTEKRDYLINPGDVLEISVWKEEGMEREVLVLPDGVFSFPLVGFIKAAGHSPSEVQEMLTERIKIGRAHV